MFAAAVVFWSEKRVEGELEAVEGEEEGKMDGRSN